MKVTLLRKVEFAPDMIRTDTVLQNMCQKGSECYTEDLEDLLALNEGVIAPCACWREILVKEVKDDTVDLCGRLMKDAYLASRLQGIRTVKIFQAGITDDTWEVSKKLSDPIDQFLYSQIMSTCFNLAFRQVCVDMTRSMPKGAKLFMDNPGITGGWALEHQDTLLDMLYYKEDSAEVLRPTNPMTFSGIVYTSNLGDSTRENIRYMSGEKLVSILYQTAGIIPPEDI